MSPVRRAVIAAAAWLVAAGCGVSVESEPVLLDGSALPADPVSDTPAAGTEEGSVVFLVAGDRLQPVSRVGRGSVTATLGALFKGPRAAEVAAGLRSAVPAGTELLGVKREGDVTRVDLSEEFTSVVGEEALLALGQVVLTVAGPDPAARVAIWIEGEPVPVARGDGQVTSEPVVASDYAGLLAP